MHVRSLVFRNRAPRAWLARRGTRLIAGRARQHVNPLSAHFQQPCEPPQWDSVFTDLTKPLFIDVGCAYGSYSVAYAKVGPRARCPACANFAAPPGTRRAHSLASIPAQTFPDWNVLGLEIREAVLTMSKASTKAEQCPNLHFVATNANVSLPSLLDSMPPELRTRRVALLHPDPWFKKRHQKRRYGTARSQCAPRH